MDWNSLVLGGLGATALLNTLGLSVLAQLHVGNAKAIAIMNAGGKLVTDGVRAAPGGVAGEIAAAPVLLADAGAVAAALNLPNK